MLSFLIILIIYIYIYWRINNDIAFHNKVNYILSLIRKYKSKIHNDRKRLGLFLQIKTYIKYFFLKIKPYTFDLLETDEQRKYLLIFILFVIYMLYGNSF